jgi:hypothetical protein
LLTTTFGFWLVGELQAFLISQSAIQQILRRGQFAVPIDFHIK